MLCRFGAIELDKIIKYVDKKFPSKVIFYVFGPNSLSLDEFKANNYLQDTQIFLPKEGPAFYKKLQFLKPGICKCWGLCYRNVMKNYFKFKEKNVQTKVRGNFKGDLSQLGGCFILDKMGKIVFQHFDSFLGDHLTLDEIGSVFDNLLREKILEGGSFIQSDLSDNSMVYSSDQSSASKNPMPQVMVNNKQKGVKIQSNGNFVRSAKDRRQSLQSDAFGKGRYIERILNAVQGNNSPVPKQPRYQDENKFSSNNLNLENIKEYYNKLSQRNDMNYNKIINTNPIKTRKIIFEALDQEEEESDIEQNISPILPQNKIRTTGKIFGNSLENDQNQSQSNSNIEEQSDQK